MPKIRRKKQKLGEPSSRDQKIRESLKLQFGDNGNTFFGKIFDRFGKKRKKGGASS